METRPFAAWDLAWLDRLVPHLEQAYRVHARLRGHLLRENAYERVLDRFPTGTVLLNAEGRVLTSNRAARRIASLNDGFSLEDRRVFATVPESDAVFQRAVCALLERPFEAHPAPERGLTLERPSGLRPFDVMVSPLFAGSAVGMLDDAFAAIYITDPEFRQLEMRSLLGAFHRLTNAEIELAALICGGETLKASALARGVSIHTARTQLRNIFMKTSTRRQAELVRLVKGGLMKLGPNVAPGGSPDED
jgi:DNA-binding CsgD family transcriptional regulator